MGSMTWCMPRCGGCCSTRNEHADRVLRLVDVDGEELSGERLWPLLAADAEPELAWRNKRALAARLLSNDVNEGELTVPSDAAAWRLDLSARGSLSQLRIVEASQALRAS